VSPRLAALFVSAGARRKLARRLVWIGIHSLICTLPAARARAPRMPAADIGLADKKKPKDTTDTPKENVQFNDGSVQWNYTQQKPLQGTNHPTPKSGAGGSMRH
jgi:hypothetical protein